MRRARLRNGGLEARPLWLWVKVEALSGFFLLLLDALKVAAVKWVVDAVVGLRAAVVGAAEQVGVVVGARAAVIVQLVFEDMV